MTMVACKKENQPTDNGTLVTSSQVSVHPEQIDDMNAYLDGYRQRMMEGAKDGEALTLADAQWLLTNLANQDFGNVVEQFDDIRFDDLSTSINIEDGLVSLPALNEAYKSIFGEIRAYYRSLDLQDKNCRIIICTINPDGTVNTHVTLSYGNGAKLFGGFYINSEADCEQYLDSTIVYYGNTVAVDELNRILNRQVFHPADYSGSRVYYTLHTTRLWSPTDLFDNVTPSPSYMHSRLYYKGGGYFNSPIPYHDMCYYLDSYAGIVEDYWPTGCCLASILVGWESGQVSKGQEPHWHKLTVRYGVLQGSTSEPAVD